MTFTRERVTLRYVVGPLLAVALVIGLASCGHSYYCSGFVQVICVSSQQEAEQLNRSAGCDVSYEVCEPQDASYTPPPDALPSLVGDGAVGASHADASDSASDAPGDVASEAPAD